MSHYIGACTESGDDIDYVNLAGDLSSFYKFFNVEDTNRITNGDGKIKTPIR